MFTFHYTAAWLPVLNGWGGVQVSAALIVFSKIPLKTIRTIKTTLDKMNFIKSVFFMDRQENYTK